MNKRDLALDIAKRFLNLPYRWGGDDTIGGFDCSGLVIEILKGVGIVSEKFDATANQLASQFEETEILQPGVLVYWDWNKDGKIDHVEMVAFVDDNGEVFTIGASGGGSSTTSPQSAQEANAFVKIRPLRSGYELTNDPFVIQ